MSHCKKTKTLEIYEISSEAYILKMIAISKKTGSQMKIVWYNIHCGFPSPHPASLSNYPCCRQTFFAKTLPYIWLFIFIFLFKLCYKIGFMFYMINSTTDSPCNIILTPYCQLFLIKLSSFHCIGKWGFNCVKHEVNASSRLQSIKCVGAEGWSKKVSKNGTNVLPPLIHHIGNCLIRVAFNLWKKPWWWRMVFYAKALNILYL